MPSVNDTRRRYSKSSSSKRLSPTSATPGLFFGKGRSNSTPNPEPISRSNARQSKQSGSKEQPINEQINESAPLMASFVKSSDSINLPDVFTFLEKEDEFHSGAEDGNAGATIQGGDVPTGSNPELPMPETPHYSDLEVHANEAHEHDIWRHSTLHDTSFHSDSGVSMGSSSPVVRSHMSKRRQSSAFVGTSPDDVAPDPILEGPCRFEDSTHPPSFSDFSSPPRSWTSIPTYLNDTPEAYYAIQPHAIPEVAQYSRTPTYEGSSPSASLPLQEGLYRYEKLPSKPDGSGYDLLASSIDSKSEEFLRPIYRKFETLNNRMLLYLQDEISEAQERLRELDDTIAQENQYYGNKSASRRAEASFPSHLQLQRIDLLARTFAKVEQYSKDEIELGIISES